MLKRALVVDGGAQSKPISGGQSGVDASIVPDGEQLDIPIGGGLPQGWMTEDGPEPGLAALGSTEAESDDYAGRTRRNVEDGDATLVFATDPDSDGTRLTLDYAASRGKPQLLVDPFDPVAVDRVRRWLLATRPAVLNVAGNRERRSPGICRAAAEVLMATLRQV